MHEAMNDIILACLVEGNGRNLSILVLLGNESNSDGLSRGD